MPGFALQIVTPERTAYSGSVQRLRAPGSQGEFGVLGGHIPMVAALRVGSLSFVEEGGRPRRLAIGGGLAEVRRGAVTILAETAEFAEGIDVGRAEAARDRARERLRERRDVDVPRAKAALARALTRLAVARGG